MLRRKGYICRTGHASKVENLADMIFMVLQMLRILAARNQPYVNMNCAPLDGA